MPDVGQGSCATDARKRGASARCDGDRNATHAAKNRRAAALRGTLVMTFAVAMMDACATSPERTNVQPSGQQTCNVAGKFCNTFFGP
ncbi:hypothetical protein HDG33_001503 [Paraburkholderia sp. Cpub6]|nr:hypothetical protein [Paraburkholderia sp. Cpub6]